MSDQREAPHLAQHDRHVMAWVDHWMRSPQPPDEVTARWLETALVFEAPTLH